MKLKNMIVTVSAVVICFMASSYLPAEELKFKILEADTIKSIIERHVEKRITVKLDSEVQLTGIVTKVGVNVVQLTRGNDFNDAVIRIKNINALLMN